MTATLIGRTPELRFVNAALLVLGGGLIVAGACSFSPRTPEVDPATVWIDTVQRGELIVERRGAGQLHRDDSGALYAQVRIPETQSLDLEIGQEAVVNLHVAETPARVAELGDEIVQGVRLVRLELTGDVPEQALPGLSIDARIRVDVMDDVLFVGKPAYGQSNARVGLFKLVDDGRHAERVEVQTGVASVNLVQILEGLEEGDRIILSDMSRYDTTSRVALR